MRLYRPHTRLQSIQTWFKRLQMRLKRSYLNVDGRCFFRSQDIELFVQFISFFMSCNSLSSVSDTCRRPRLLRLSIFCKKNSVKHESVTVENLTLSV